jgi:hypothetical protein
MGSTSYDLPQPIVQTGEALANRMKKVTVPLRAGSIIGGVVRAESVLPFQGTISKNTRSGVLYEKRRFQNLLMKTSGQTFTFYRFYDSTKGNYRWYENCVCQDLSFSVASTQVFSMTYSMTIIVPDGTEHELITTRGESPSGSTSGNLSGVHSGGAFLGDSYDAADGPGSETLPDDTVRVYGPVVIKLRDSLGASSVLIQNSNGDYIFRIDSDGKVQAAGIFETVDSVDWP